MDEIDSPCAALVDGQPIKGVRSDLAATTTVKLIEKDTGSF